MVLICPKCEARLRLDEAKLPSHPFSVRCPKCQTSVDVQPHNVVGNEPVAAAETVSAPVLAVFERQVAAPQFNSKAVDGNALAVNQGTPSGLDDIARVLAQALRSAESGSASGRGRKRAGWDRRKVLVCTSPAYRSNTPWRSSTTWLKNQLISASRLLGAAHSVAACYPNI